MNQELEVDDWFRDYTNQFPESLVDCDILQCPLCFKSSTTGFSSHCSSLHGDFIPCVCVCVKK